jgi:hypothetical protein
VATSKPANHSKLLPKAGHEYQSDGNEMADDDDFGQDWEELCRAQKYDFQSYVSVDRHVATSGIETVEELCEVFGSARSVEEEDEEDENEQEMVLSFTETYEALQKVKSVCLCAKWKWHGP